MLRLVAALAVVALAMCIMPSGAGATGSRVILTDVRAACHPRGGISWEVTLENSGSKDALTSLTVVLQERVSPQDEWTLALAVIYDFIELEAGESWTGGDRMSVLGVSPGATELRVYAEAGFNALVSDPVPVCTGKEQPPLGDADCNAIVSSVDATVVLQYTAALLAALSCPAEADVNSDGRVDSVDASLILQHVAGLTAP